MTRGELKTLLAPYFGANQDQDRRLDAVRARLLPMGNWRGSKQVVGLTVYTDVDGNNVVTLPYGFNTILAGRPSSDSCGTPLGVVSEWYRLLPDSQASACGNDFEEQTGRYCNYLDWVTPMKLRFKAETSEPLTRFTIRGTYLGDEVYSMYETAPAEFAWTRGEIVTGSTQFTRTTTKLFDARRLSIVKTPTNGRITMYVVDEDDKETKVAVFAPSETLIAWKRYRVPGDGGIVIPAIGTGTVIIVSGGQSYTKEELDAMFADVGVLAFDSDGTNTLAYGTFFFHTVKLEADEGTGAYERKIVLENLGVDQKSGAILRVRVAVADSANPTIRFYDDSVSGTLLQEIVGDANQEFHGTLTFEYDATGSWRYIGTEF